jgi:nitrogen fixation/metabolism regulation signal transduction histidine kinase
MMRRLLLLLPIIAIVFLLYVALWLAGDAERAGSQLGNRYVWLLGAAGAGVLVLIGIVGFEFWRLVRQLRLGIPGSRINARLALLIALISLPPIVLVSIFAIRFVDSSVDSWFRADVASAQENAEAIGREVLASFERRARDLASRIAASDELINGADQQTMLDDVVDRVTEPVHVTLLSSNGGIVAISFNTAEVVFPPAPSDQEWLQVRAAGQLALNERTASSLTWRVLQPFNGDGLLQAVVPIPADLASRLNDLERTAIDYSQLKFQRDALKSTFTLILGLVGLLALLIALLVALAAARRLIRPISNLVVAAGEITAGRYGQAIRVTSADELGDLTTTFNRMSHELAEASSREREARSEVEHSRNRLEAILERMSAGVVSFDSEHILSANPAAAALLEIDPNALIGIEITSAGAQFPRAASFFEFLGNCATEKRAQWRQEVRLEGEPVRALLIRGTLLPGVGASNFVAVFDDAAVIALGQREAAWAEVAKRLAHEIKNPLTPIQLAAERLRHKYLGKMTPEESDVLNRATQTIVAQVDALKRIVNAFGDYTRVPQSERQSFDLRELLDEVCGLYEDSGQCEIHRLNLATDCFVYAHKDRMRQALINVFTNAIEATTPEMQTRIEIELSTQTDKSVALRIRDHGKGLPHNFDERWFEPYNSTKPKGSGLGLAWVKKVVQECGGNVTATNAPGGGALFTIVLPNQT